jgi:cytochrome c oxidase subunit 2
MYFKKLISCLTAFFLAPLSFSAWDDINMTPGANAIAQEIFGLHMTIFWICVVIGALV